MTPDEVLALPVAVPLADAGKVFGMGRTKAYDLARQGKFPVRVIPVGPKYVVPRSALLEALEIGTAPTAPTSKPKRRRAAPARGATRQGSARANDDDSLPAA